MHWLDDQVARLRDMAEEHAEARARARALGSSTEEERRARDDFLRATRGLVAAIGDRRGVTACFVSHDGLLADCCGEAADFEALAAVAQTCASTARDAGLGLSLGAVGQVVLVGEEQKLALLLVGQLALGILCPVETRLHEVLGR